MYVCMNKDFLSCIDVCMYVVCMLFEYRFSVRIGISECKWVSAIVLWSVSSARSPSSAYMYVCMVECMYVCMYVSMYTKYSNR